MTQDEEPAIYRSLSIEGLRRLRGDYLRRLQRTQGEALRAVLAKRMQFLDDELQRRKDLPDEPEPG